MEGAFNLLSLADEKLPGGQKGREVWISHPRHGVTAALLVCFSLSAHLEGELRVVFGRLGKRKCKWAATEVGLGTLPLSPTLAITQTAPSKDPPPQLRLNSKHFSLVHSVRQAEPDWAFNAQLRDSNRRALHIL